MKKALLLVLLCAGMAQPLRAQGTFGFGFILGEPTGFSWKYRINRMNALDGAIGFGPFDRFRIHVDYLWNARPFRDPGFALYYGIGGVFGFGRTDYVRQGRNGFITRTDLGFGLRIPFGIDYMIPRSPVELFFELAPLFIFAPDTGVGFDIGIGLRFYP